MAGLQCDLTRRDLRPNGLGLLRSQNGVSVKELFSKISAHTYILQYTHGLSVFWVVPSASNLERYNTIQLERKDLTTSSLHQDEWHRDGLEMAGNLNRLEGYFLRKKTIPFLMAEAYGSNTFEEGSDGVHMPKSTRKKVMRRIVREAVSQYPVPFEPTKQKLRSVARQEACTERKRRYRRIQKGKKLAAREARRQEAVRTVRHEHQPRQEVACWQEVRRAEEEFELLPLQFHGRHHHSEVPALASRSREDYDPESRCPSRFQGRVTHARCGAQQMEPQPEHRDYYSWTLGSWVSMPTTSTKPTTTTSGHWYHGY